MNNLTVNWGSFSLMFFDVATLLDHLALDNNFKIKWNRIELSNKLVIRLRELQKEAKKLDGCGKKAFVFEEATITEAYVKVYKLRKLHNFLSDCFDGDLNEVFYEET